MYITFHSSLNFKNEFLLSWMNWYSLWKYFLQIFIFEKSLLHFPPKVTHTWNEANNTKINREKNNLFLHPIPSGPTSQKSPILIIWYIGFHSFQHIHIVSFYKNEITLYTLLSSLNILDIQNLAHNSILLITA